MDIAQALVEIGSPWVAGAVELDFAGENAQNQLAFINIVANAVNFTRACQGKPVMMFVRFRILYGRVRNQDYVKNVVKNLVDELAVDGEKFSVDAKPSTLEHVHLITLRFLV